MRLKQILYNSRVPGKEMERPPRADPRDIAELKRLKAERPDLASAVDLQLALLDLQRRVQARVPLPRVDIARAFAQRGEGDARPLLRFEDIPLDWTDLRLMFREVLSILHRFGHIGAQDVETMQRLGREADRLKPFVERWYSNAALHDQAGDVPEMLDQVLLLAMRPFLARSAEAILPRVDFSAWRRGRCPLCGGEPDFAEITPSADRLLVCGRCTGRWQYDPLGCPFCGNNDRRRITSFASRDSLYRIYACDECKRYLKAYDSRRSARPLMMSVDSIATLPLDAAAMEKGYRSEEPGG